MNKIASFYPAPLHFDQNSTLYSVRLFGTLEYKFSGSTVVVSRNIRNIASTDFEFRDDFLDRACHQELEMRLPFNNFYGEKVRNYARPFFLRKQTYA